jgi:endonuclease/exonuclease/phosphatase family metal-dependent hydrolase
MLKLISFSFVLVAAAFCTTYLSAQELPDSVSVATWNLEWFFDDFQGDNSKGLPRDQSAPSRDEWEWKLDKVSDAIAEMNPTIIALQEVEDRDAVYAICRKLKDDHGMEYRYAFVGGYEFATEQDVAIMYRDRCIVEYGRKEQTGDMYETKKYYNLGKQIFAKFEWGEGDLKQSLFVYNVHLRAGADKENIRKRQCELVRHWVQEDLEAGENVIVLGDFNTEYGAGVVESGSDVEIIKGSTTESADDNLTDLNEQLAADERDTHLTGKEFDRIFASAAARENDQTQTDMLFSKIVCRKDLVVVGEQDKDHFNTFYDIPQAERDVSDHYPVIAEFLFK